MASLCESNCKILPENFRTNLDALFSDMFARSEKVPKDLDAIISELEKVLKKQSPNRFAI